jgi:hypothetical protein
MEVIMKGSRVLVLLACLTYVAGCSTATFDGKSSHSASQAPKPSPGTGDVEVHPVVDHSAPDPGPTPSPSPTPTVTITSTSDTGGSVTSTQEVLGPGKGLDTVSPAVIAVPAYATKAGDFFVWTVPQDPAPRQDYNIYIEVILPLSVTQYTRDDLSGEVVGTDGYQEYLGPTTGPLAQREGFGFVPGKALLAIWVPGGNNAVNDTIDVQSRVLNEAQTVQLQF